MMEGNDNSGSPGRREVLDLINHGISKTDNPNKIPSSKRRIDDESVRNQFNTYQDMKRKHPESSIKLY